MAVLNSTIIMGIALIFIYITIYKKNNFFGNIIFMLLGLGILSTNSTDNLSNICGWIILVSGFLNMIYDFYQIRHVNHVGQSKWKN